MDTQERHDRIVTYVQEHRSATVETLAQSLSASRETIRRDLSRLAERGLLRKVHGGAVLHEVRGEGSFKTRLTEQRSAKRQIARAAAALFAPGDSLFIDNGSTTLAFAEELARIGGMTVVTNGTLIAAAVAQAAVAPERNGKPRSHVYLIGGSFAEDGVETVGPLAMEQVRRFHAQHVVLTIGALDARRGVLDHNIDEAEIARSMIAQAERMTVIADASKLGRTAMFEVCALSEIDRLVTEAEPAPDLVQALEEAGIEVIIAQA
jgi:DeoR/GlpR family transcriptional regulator of sugar metabolism